MQARALRCHETQVVVGDGWYALSNHVVSRLAGREGYARARRGDRSTDERGSTVSDDLLDDARFRQAMGRLVAGVSVLTTFAEGHDHAMTADTLTSVSLDPLLVLVCAETETRWHDAVARRRESSGSACWRPTSVRCRSGSPPGAARCTASSTGRRTTAARCTGVALLDGALMHLECRTTDIHPAGDHAIVVAEVLSIALPDTVGPALVHFRGRYGSIA